MRKFGGIALLGVCSLAACTSDPPAQVTQNTESARATDSTQIAGPSRETAQETTAVAVETTGAALESTAESTAESVVPTPSAPPISHRPDAVVVPFDAARNEARPLKETVKPIASPTDVLSMKITGIAYRGLICGFSFQGDAPAAPVTIQQRVQSPAGTYDSGPIAVSWTGLDDATVEAGSSQDQSWNFSAEAHRNRSGPGWVVSIGGVTASIGGDDAPITPTDASCEIRSAEKVFVARVGPVGYWAGFAVT
jgi:hypothetical protein